MPYVMHTLGMSSRPFTDADRRIAARLSAYVVNFIKTGDPNGPGLPEWPAVGSEPALTMQVGDSFTPIPVASTPERRAFFEAFFARQGAGRR